MARRLTGLISLDGVAISADDFWMPRGLPIEDAFGNWDVSPTKEPKLGEVEAILPLKDREALTAWWLNVSKGANTPNWDVVSTCSFRGSKGLVLIEAKAHDKELRKEEAGKSSPDASSANSVSNHVQIGAAIEEARRGLERATEQCWGISRDSHYQMSNRFAWSWKLAQLDYPVALVYLGFLNALEMSDKGAPLQSHREWEDLVRNHSERLCPAAIWDHSIDVNGRSIVPVIRSVEQPLSPAALHITDNVPPTRD